jgi:hypothetical protein
VDATSKLEPTSKASNPVVARAEKRNDQQSKAHIAAGDKPIPPNQAAKAERLEAQLVQRLEAKKEKRTEVNASATQSTGLTL